MANIESRLVDLEQKLERHIVHFAATIREERAARELMHSEFRQQIGGLRETLQSWCGRVELDLAKINRTIGAELPEIRALMLKLNEKLEPPAGNGKP